MKLTCDLCGGELQMNACGQGACCANCGLEYSKERLMEMLNSGTTVNPEPVVETPPVKDVPPVKDAREVPSKKPTAAAVKTAQKKMKIMWIILAAIGLFAFFSTLFTDSALPLVSFPALLITLFIFKPWKVYGGKAI